MLDHKQVSELLVELHLFVFHFVFEFGLPFDEVAVYHNFNLINPLLKECSVVVAVRVLLFGVSVLGKALSREIFEVLQLFDGLV